MNWCPCLVISGMLFGCALAGVAETIDTYAFDPTGQLPCVVSALALGPEGEIWFGVDDPSRVVRVSRDRMECVLASDDPRYGTPEVTVAPSGEIYLYSCDYVYSDERGVSATGIQLPWDDDGSYYYVNTPAMFDADMRIYCVWGGYYFSPWRQAPPEIWELRFGFTPVQLYGPSSIGIPLIVSINECWVGYNSRYFEPCVLEIDLEVGESRNRYEGPDRYVRVAAKDANGRLWLAVYPDIQVLDIDGCFSVFADGNRDNVEYDKPALTADGTVWSQQRGLSGGNLLSVARFNDEDMRLFTVEDGLLANGYAHSPVIDFDGSVWLLSAEYGSSVSIGLSRITEGGWPPMRLMLHEAATGGRIAVEAQVINNGPVVGVDVYVAIELNGQLLYWPNWQPEPHPNQINLRPGHNQTATIIEARREDIPPGSYTFWGCMTGRNTSKLIGPIDRKFESLAVQID